MRNLQPSRTAQSVATNILLLSYDPVFGCLIPKDTATITRWFLQATPGISSGAATLLDSPFFRAYAELIEKLTIPGISIHTALRKLWIEEQVRAYLAAGITQVMVLGAGFDTLAYRLHQEFSKVAWFEIDHPATQQVKQKALVQYGNPQKNLQLLPVDFSQHTFAGTLIATQPYVPSENTLFIAEGLLMYLTAAEVADILKTIYQHSGIGSCLVGTLLAPLPDGELALQGGSRIANIQLELCGEPYQWGISPQDLPSFLAQNSFQVVEVKQVKEIISQYLPKEHSEVRLPAGEYLFTAKKEVISDKRRMDGRKRSTGIYSWPKSNTVG